MGEREGGKEVKVRKVQLLNEIGDTAADRDGSAR